MANIHPALKITQEHHKLTDFLKKAENHGVYAVESLMNGVAYVYKDDEFAIATCKGHVRMNKKDAVKMAKEIIDIFSDIEYIHNWKRGGNNEEK